MKLEAWRPELYPGRGSDEVAWLRTSSWTVVVRDLHQPEPFGGGPPDLDAGQVSRLAIRYFDPNNEPAEGDSKNSPHEACYQVSELCCSPPPQLN